MGGSGTAVESPGPGGAARAAGEARLAHQAADGDGAAFAALYDRYELLVYNVCLRVLGSPEYATVATQRAFLGALERWREAGPGELELSVELLVAAHGVLADKPDRDGWELKGDRSDGAFDPTLERHVDPERAELLASLQHDVKRANERLSEPRREVLALRDLEGFSYEQIAVMIGAEPASVVEAIAEARVGLRDALRDGSQLATATATADCQRGLRLLAMRADGQLDDRADREWLDGHLAECDACEASLDAMQEARIAYRAWLPLLAPPWLRADTLAAAGGHAGAEGNGAAARRWSPHGGNGAAARKIGLATAAAVSPEAAAAEGAASPIAVAGAAGRGSSVRLLHRRALLAIAIPVVLLAGATAAVLAAGLGSGAHKRGSHGHAAPATAPAASPVSPTAIHTRKHPRRHRAAATSNQPPLSTPTQPTTPAFTPPRTTPTPAPVSRAPQRTPQPQQQQQIGGGREHGTPQQPAPSQPTPTAPTPTPTAPTGTVGPSSG